MADGWRHLIVVGLGVLAVLALVSALIPGPAQALSIPNPVNVVGGLAGIVGGALTGPISQLAVQAFAAIIEALFRPIAKFVDTQLIGWLVAVPNFTQGNVRPA